MVRSLEVHYTTTGKVFGGETYVIETQTHPSRMDVRMAFKALRKDPSMRLYYHPDDDHQREIQIQWGDFEKYTNEILYVSEYDGISKWYFRERSFDMEQRLILAMVEQKTENLDVA